MDTNASQPKLTTYENSARRHREKLAFVEHICGVMIEDRFDGEEPPRPWRVFHGDVESMFSKVSCYELMPDWAFEFMPGEFVFSRFVSHGSARPGTRTAANLWDAKGEPPASAGGFLSNIGAKRVWDSRSNSPPVSSSVGLGRGSPMNLGTQPPSAVPQSSAARLA